MSRNKKKALNDRTWPAFKHRTAGPKKGNGSYGSSSKKVKVKGADWKPIPIRRDPFAKLGEVMPDSLKLK